MTASPISDLNPLFLAAGVTLQVASKGEKYHLDAFESFHFSSHPRIIIKNRLHKLQHDADSHICAGV